MSILNYNRFALPCPKCRGSVFRSITFWQRLLSFLPVHMWRKSQFRCENCHTRFFGRTFLGDVILPLIFTSSQFVIPEGWIMGIGIMIVWLGFSLYVQAKEIDGPIHVYIGFLLAGLTWMVALLDFARQRPWLSDFGPFFPMACGFVAAVFVFLADLMLVLDHRYPPYLTEVK
jgi:hypothetical protein